MTPAQERAFKAFSWLGLSPGPAVFLSPEEAWLRHAVQWSGVRAVRGIEGDDVLHAGRRGRIVMRHTVAHGSGGKHVAAALADAYPLTREKPLLYLLRRHQLDDAFWRMIYALMVQGGPIVLSELVALVVRLTDDRAQAHAVRLLQRWWSEHRRRAPRVRQDG